MRRCHCADGAAPPGRRSGNRTAASRPDLGSVGDHHVGHRPVGGQLFFDADLLIRGRLLVDYADPVLTITLNRPDLRNAQLPATWEALAHIGSRLPGGVRVVVVRGAGGSFSSGLDRSMLGRTADSVLVQLASAPDSIAHNMIAGFQKGFAWLADPSFISIAAVSGHAVGAGFQLALACDLVLAADDAQFCMAEVGHGLIPDLGGTGALVRAVGHQRALEICVTGRRIGAGEAVRIGLALATVPVAELDQSTADLVDAVTGAPVEAVRAVTRLVASAAVATPTDQLAAEQAEQLNRVRELAAGQDPQSHEAGRP